MLPISFPIVSFLSWPQLVSFVLMICFPNPMWRLWAPRISQNGNLCDSRILCQDPSSTPAPERRGQMHLRIFPGAPMPPHSPLMTQVRDCHLKVVLGVASFVSSISSQLSTPLLSSEAYSYYWRHVFNTTSISLCTTPP